MPWIRLEIEMPLEKRPVQNHRGAPLAVPRRPFHLRLPDVMADQKTQAAPDSEVQLPRQPAPYDPIAKAKAQLSEKRYQDGHQQVTGLIDRLREKRRRLFDRLWIASIALTALSVVALAVELIQSMQSPVPARVATAPFKKNDTVKQNDTAKKQDAPRQITNRTSPSPARTVSPVAAREWSNESPDDQPVKSALYTTEEGPKPKGVWLDGLVPNPDPDSERPTNGVQHDDPQSRTP
jgi:hypothetical protein